MTSPRTVLGKPAVLAFALVAALAAPPADAQRRAVRAPAISPACTDFYSVANAEWLQANPVPGGTAAVTALGQLRDITRQQQHDLLQRAMTAPQNDIQQRLGDFWASGLDEAAVEQDGATPIAGLLGRINAIKRARDIPPAIAALHQVGIPVAFNFGPDVDLLHLDRHIGYFMQGGLGLPDPDFYLRNDTETRELLGRYRAYVQQVLSLTGTPLDRLDAESQWVIDLETRIAQVSRPLLDLRSPFDNYAPVATKDLGKQYRNLQLDAFLKAQGINDDTVSMADPQVFQRINELVAGLSPEQWKAYLRWRIGDSMAPYLAGSFRDAEFDFRGRLLRGEAAQPARWQQVLNAINTAAGPMLGKEYADQYLPAATDARAEAIAAQVRDALGRGIEGNSWMSDTAKAEAKNKLAQLKIEVGTPHRDMDYSIQPMGRGSFGSNMLIASTWHHREKMKLIGRGNADRRWDVLPQQPALAYDIAQNRLIVTAAVLQPPVLDVANGEAGQYGAYGAMVAQELSRGFDNKGRHIDTQGQLRDWWTPADQSGWEALSNQIVAQYNGYPFPGVSDTNVNGRLTLERNLADLTGVELAWDAFLAAHPDADKAAKQAFYLAWSQLWAQQLSPSAATERAAIDVHAPGLWRSNGPLANQPGFGEAFDCNPGQPMQRQEADRIGIWR